MLGYTTLGSLPNFEHRWRLCHGRLELTYTNVHGSRLGLTLDQQYWVLSPPRLARLVAGVGQTNRGKRISVVSPRLPRIPLQMCRFHCHPVLLITKRRTAISSQTQPCSIFIRASSLWITLDVPLKASMISTPRGGIKKRVFSQCSHVPCSDTHLIDPDSHYQFSEWAMYGHTARWVGTNRR